MVSAVLAPGKTCGLLNPWLSRSIHFTTLENRNKRCHTPQTLCFLAGGGREILREQSQERIVDRTSGRSSPNSSNLDQVLLFEKNFTLNKGRTHLSNTYLLQNQMCKA